MDDIKWGEKFGIKVVTFDAIHANTTPKIFAIDSTKFDKRDLDLLSPTDFKCRTARLRYLDQKSNEITLEVADICNAYPNLTQYFDVAKVRK